MRLGFDLDKIFIDTPPFIPDFLIDRLYKKKDKTLSYRFPGLLEQKIRIFSHQRLFRPPIKDNIESLKKINKHKKYELFLISGRFGFLTNQTHKWLKYYRLNTFFKDIYLNLDNRQPHEFKNAMVQKLKIHKFIDDDLDALRFLSKHNPKTEFYWLDKKSSLLQQLPDNITPINNIEQLKDKYLEEQYAK